MRAARVSCAVVIVCVRVCPRAIVYIAISSSICMHIYTIFAYYEMVRLVLVVQFNPKHNPTVVSMDRYSTYSDMCDCVSLCGSVPYSIHLYVASVSSSCSLMYSHGQFEANPLMPSQRPFRLAERVYVCNACLDVCIPIGACTLYVITTVIHPTSTTCWRYVNNEKTWLALCSGVTYTVYYDIVYCITRDKHEKGIVRHTHLMQRIEERLSLEFVQTNALVEKSLQIYQCSVKR